MLILLDFICRLEGLNIVLRVTKIEKLDGFDTSHDKCAKILRIGPCWSERPIYAYNVTSPWQIRVNSGHGRWAIADMDVDLTEETRGDVPRDGQKSGHQHHIETF